MLCGQTDVSSNNLYRISFSIHCPTLSVSLRVNSWVETLCISERRKVVNNTGELKMARLIYNDSV